MDTINCLLHYPRRTLMALAAVYGVTAHYRRPKEQVARELAAAIRDRLPQTLAALGPDARAALRELAQAGDLTLPRPGFVARFGSLHPYRPWDPAAPPAPWPAPPSPAATLVHHGLVYPLNLGTRQRPVHSVVLPHDLRDTLAVRLDLPIILSTSLTPTGGLADPSSVLRTGSPTCEPDLFALLSLLNRQDVTVRSGRWMPPRVLRALNERLDPPDDLGPGRSELQAARIPFAHYLAERAGLLDLTGDLLKPTVLAGDWLAASRDERLRALWDAWREPSDGNRALWRRYRLPALVEDDDPLARFDALLRVLAACLAGPLGRPSDLLDALAERDPALLRPQATYAAWVALDLDEREDFESRARAVLRHLLEKHLTWFGVLDIGSRGAEGQRDEPILSLPNSSAPLLLTPLGAALLGRDDGDWPDDPDPAPLHVAPLLDGGEEPSVLIQASPGLSLIHRFSLEGIVPPDPAAPDHYRLSRSHFLRALQRGHTAMGAAGFLERASGEPLSAPVMGALYRWEDDLNRVTIRQTLLLQTRDPALLRDLAGQRRVRETLGKTLNERAVEVRADRLDALVRRLAWRDVIPRLDLDADLARCAAGRAKTTESEDERAALAIALRVYAHLADELGLSARPASALARRWSEGLPLRLRDAVERRVEQILDALHRASPLEMEDRLPEPTGPLLEFLERAIRERAAVEIEYYTAGRAHHTSRRVDPLRLEWRGDVVYLIAYCHLREDERVFRVDRMERIANCE